MAKPSFAFLLLKEHPYGREMLRQLLSEGFVPTIVITEDSAIGDEEREKFLKRMGVGSRSSVGSEQRSSKPQVAGSSPARGNLPLAFHQQKRYFPTFSRFQCYHLCDHFLPFRTVSRIYCATW